MPAYGISWHIWPLYSYTKWVDSELVFQKTTYWPVAKVRSFPWIGDRNMVFNSGSNNQEHDNVWHWPMIGKWTFISHWRRLRFIYLKWQRFDVYQLFVAQVVCWLCCVRLRRQQYSWCVVTYEWSCNQPTQQRLSCLRPTPTWTGCLENTTYRRRKVCCTCLSVNHLSNSHWWKVPNVFSLVKHVVKTLKGWMKFKWDVCRISY